MMSDLLGVPAADFLLEKISLRMAGESWAGGMAVPEVKAEIMERVKACEDFMIKLVKDCARGVFLNVLLAGMKKDGIALIVSYREAEAEEKIISKQVSLIEKAVESVRSFLLGAGAELADVSESLQMGGALRKVIEEVFYDDFLSFIPEDAGFGLGILDVARNWSEIVKEYTRGMEWDGSPVSSEEMERMLGGLRRQKRGGLLIDK